MTLPPLTRADIDAWHRSLSNWGRFGPDDELGTLHRITPAKRCAAAASVRSGRSVSCARPLATEPAPDNPKPALHHMIGTASEGWGGDWFAVACHGYAQSHVDALCHIFRDGRVYGGHPAEVVSPTGARRLGIQALRDGVVSRGVLLDLPRARGVDHLPAGEAVGPEDLEAAERAADVTVEPGDVLLVRTGRWVERARRGPWDPHERLAGLHASCLPWLHERGVAALGGDGVSDCVPSRVDGARLPIHEVAIVAMGLHLLDNLDLEDLGRACTEEGRAHFLLTIAPLVIEGGTGSPVNPIALF
jgi:kynurenine formamidase